MLLEKVTKLGAAAVIFTVDTAWKSKRTRDVRAKTTVQVSLISPPWSECCIGRVLIESTGTDQTD